MKNIEKFKKLRCYSLDDGRELSEEKIISFGLNPDTWVSLEDRAYQAAYDISNDWIKDEPNWEDVREGFRKGVEEGIDFVKNIIQEKINKFKEHDAPAISQNQITLENLLKEINEKI